MTFRGYGALTALGPVTKREVMPRARLLSLPATLSTLGDRDQERMQLLEGRLKNWEQTLD